MKPLFLFFLSSMIAFMFGCQQKNPKEIILKSPKVIRYSQPVCDSLFAAAFQLEQNNQKEKAIAAYEQAFVSCENTNDEKWVQYHYRTARLYMLDDKFQFADKHLEQARILAEVLKMPDSVLFEIQSWLASCKIALMDFVSARSIHARLDHLSHTKLEKGKVFSLESVIAFYVRDYELAIGAGKKALQIINTDDHETLYKLLNNIAVAHRRQKKYEVALNYINRAVGESILSSGENSKIFADVLLQKAFILRDLGRTDSIRFLLNRVATIRERIFGKKGLYTYGAWFSLAKFFFGIHQYDSAARYYHKSLLSLVEGFNSENLLSNPKPTIVEMDNNLVDGLVGKATSLKKLFENDSSKIEWLDLSLNTQLLADSVFNEYQKMISYDESKLAQLEANSVSYSEMLNAAATLFRLKKKPPIYRFHLM